MLQVCQWLYQSPNYDYSRADVMAIRPYVLLTLELSRSHLIVTNVNNMTSSEKHQLESLASSVTNAMATHKGCMVSVDMYLKVLRRFGASCFEGEYPFSLVSVLLEETHSEDQENPVIPADRVMTAAQFILDSKKPLAKFTYSTNGKYCSCFFRF